MPEIPLSFATCSIDSPGTESDAFAKRLGAISFAGFSAIELAFPDLQNFASQFLQHDVAADNYEDLCTAGREIAVMCGALGLKVMMLQPFSNFEGWPRGSPEREDALKKARGWIQIMEACETDMLQVGSSDSPANKISTASEDIVSDLRELADMLRVHSMRLAYENWCWSTHAPTWKNAWDIVRQVDRPNMGLCLDTFQIAGSEWADPTTTSGKIEDDEPVDKRFEQSLATLSRTVPAEKIYLLQISDAYRPEPEPLKDEDIEGMRPRARWSHAFRPLPYQGGYLPVEEVTKAVYQTGFRGWFSVEVFDRGPRGEGREYDMYKFAKEGKESVDELIKRCSIGNGNRGGEGAIATDTCYSPSGPLHHR